MRRHSMFGTELVVHLYKKYSQKFYTAYSELLMAIRQDLLTK